MEKMIVVILVLMGSKISNAQTWEAQTSGTSFDLRAVHFVNSTVGTVVGGSGTILRTTDGGVTWITQNSGTLEAFEGVHFFDANTGWVVGGTGMILSTTDGGTTWSPQTSGVTTTLEDIFFTDANTGYAAGRYGKFLSTTDGGSNWTVSVFNEASDWFQAISFSDANHGFAGGFWGTMLRMENGNVSRVKPLFSGSNVYGVAAVSADTAYNCGSSGSIQKTTDGGATWNSLTSGTTKTLLETSFFDGSNGLVVGYSGTILMTTDGGASWSLQTSGTTVQLWGVWCIDGGTAVAVGNGGTILRSTVVSLPVELTTFSASANRQGVELNWETATEVNNYGFEIEKKAVSGWPLASSQQPNANNWSKIGFVEGNGTTNSPKSYNFVDVSAQGKVAYRLKQIDRDGRFAYSRQVEVNVGGGLKVFALEQNYPNPFNPMTTIGFTIPADGTTTLKVYNTLGQEAATLVNEPLKAGEYHQVQFDASKLASGIYVARLQSGSMVQLKKMLLLK